MFSDNSKSTKYAVWGTAIRTAIGAVVAAILKTPF
jgi:hypothetical protein